MRVPLSFGFDFDHDDDLNNPLLVGQAKNVDSLPREHQ